MGGARVLGCVKRTEDVERLLAVIAFLLVYGMFPHSLLYGLFKLASLE
jgi:hypothetical protein